MTTLRGPFATLAVVGAAAAGLWLLNTSQDPATAPIAAPAPAAVVQPAEAPPVQLPAPADYSVQIPNYSVQIPTKGASIALDISVAGATAKAYACDGYDIETWLSGPVTGDALNLTSADRVNRLEVWIQDRAVVGTLFIGERSWDFTAPVVTDVR